MLVSGCWLQRRNISDSAITGPLFKQTNSTDGLVAWMHKYAWGMPFVGSMNCHTGKGKEWALSRGYCGELTRGSQKLKCRISAGLGSLAALTAGMTRRLFSLQY